MNRVYPCYNKPVDFCSIITLRVRLAIGRRKYYSFPNTL